MFKKRMAFFYVLLHFDLIGCEHKLPEQTVSDECSPPDFVPYDRGPQVIKQVQPQYPEAARQTGLQGTVWVKALVNDKGRVAKAEIQKSDAEIFNQPALDAIKQFVFTPAVQRGEPVCVWISIPFHFKP